MVATVSRTGTKRVTTIVASRVCPAAKVVAKRCGRKPIRPTLTRYAPGVRLRATNEPSSFVTALSEVPTSTTRACATGVPAESVTRPVNTAPVGGVVSLDRDDVSAGRRPRLLSAAPCPYVDAVPAVTVHATARAVPIARCHRQRLDGARSPPSVGRSAARSRTAWQSRDTA